MTDPYRPPDAASDEDAPLEVATGDWNARVVLKQMRAAFFARPISATLAVFVVPTAWSLPAHRLSAVLGLHDDQDGPLVASAISAVVVAWGYIAEAGTIRCALSIVARTNIVWIDFVRSLRYAPKLLLAGAITFIPMELPRFLPLSSLHIAALTGAIGLGSIAFSLRVLIWPVLLLQGHPFWSAFELAWASTRGKSWSLLALAVAAGAVVIPCAVLEFGITAELGLSQGAVLSMNLMGAFAALSAAQVYALAFPESSVKPFAPVADSHP